MVAYDFGVKHNILRMLAERGCDVTVVPAQTSAADVLALQPDGVFLSNGPGDPAPCDYAITAIREFIAKKTPTFGICLGHQLLALAAGAQTSRPSSSSVPARSSSARPASSITPARKPARRCATRGTAWCW